MSDALALVLTAGVSARVRRATRAREESRASRTLVRGNSGCVGIPLAMDNGPRTYVAAAVTVCNCGNISIIEREQGMR